MIAELMFAQFSLTLVLFMGVVAFVFLGRWARS